MAPVRDAWRDSIVFALRPETPVAVADAPLLLRAVRRALMALSRDRSGAVPRLFSGHESDGAPARSGRHDHVFLAADDTDGDGRLDCLIIAAWMGERSISAGRDMIGSSAVTGSGNTVTTTYTSQKITLPAPDSVDISAEVAALRELLLSLSSPERGKMERALADAEEEAAKASPNKDELGGALGRAIGYAKQANGFAEQVAKLKPHLEKTCAWLGENWHKLLAVAGIAS